jgi:quinohemoprotein ethanol dehydrogenase
MMRHSIAKLRPALSCALVLSLALAACAKSGDDGAATKASTADNALLATANNGDDWPSYGGTWDERHFSPLAEINDKNVGQLGLAWSLDLPLGNPATIPVEVSGTIYMSSGLSVVRAIDAATGKLLWTYDPKVGEHQGKAIRSAWGSRGIAYWNGKLYTGTLDGRLIAIDAKTGAETWSVQTTQIGNGQFISGAPRVFDGKVIIGQGGGDSTLNRGYATAYDAETGKQLWRFFIVPGDPAKGFENKAMAMAARTWTGEWWKLGGGGEPWGDFTYDRATNTILIGTGNGYPWNRKIRSPGGGDNLFLCSMVALDADTGAYKWHYQYNPGESWDYNATMDMTLADVTIDGKPRKVVMSAPKNGFFYVIDRTNGKLISAEKIARVTWASKIDLATGRPVENPAARFENGKSFELWPGNNGAHSWMPMAFSPKTGLVYIPTREDGIVYDDRGIDLKHWKYATGTLGQNVNFPPATERPTSALLAWNPVTQKPAWKIPNIGGWNGGVLATAGNLVFQGQIDGGLRAYAADSGKQLWRFDGQAAILAAPISYKVGGKQYVTVVVGMGASATLDARTHGGLEFDARSQKRRVLTFVLGGAAKLPPAPPPFKVQPIADLDYRPDPVLAGRGAAIFGANCLACHGYNAIAGGGAPDLRVSPVPQNADAFRGVVHDGALKDTGMPQFSELTDPDLAALRQYFRSLNAGLAGKK